jgi:3-(3-hydroxy-phenyl)propionate hydroxylase
VTAPRVVVVGAGPTGVTAAILLGQRGVPVLVLDRWPEVYPQPRAVHLDDEVCRIVARLGITDEFAAVSRPGAGLRLLGPDHRVLAQFDRAKPITDNGFPQANMFDQPDLEALLRARMSAFPSIDFRPGVEVLGVRTDPDGRPVVDLTDAVTGRREEVGADYVLGCDGANSIVRQAIGSSMRSLGFEQRWLVIDVDVERDLGHWGGVHQLCDPRRAATYMQINERRHRWELQLLDGETAEQFQDLDALGPLLGRWVDGLDDLQLIRVAEYTFRAQVADRWRRGPVFLLGDAAHTTPPFIGQGLCAGVRDAANLSWKVADVLQGSLDPEVLDTYEVERKPHALAMIRLAMLVGRIMTGGGRFGSLLRRGVAPMLPLLPGLRGRIIDSCTPPLSRSALVRRGLRPGSLAGGLCPNAQVADGRFDDVVEGRFALVTSTDPDEDTRAALEASGIVVVRAEPGGGLAAWLSRGRASAAVVRPDATVLASGRSLGDVLTDVPVPVRTRAS